MGYRSDAYCNISVNTLPRAMTQAELADTIARLLD